MVKKNNTLLDRLDKISDAINDQCGSLCMDDADDRARMALWINDNFCIKDWRVSMNKYFQKGDAMPGNEAIKGRKISGAEIVIDDEDPEKP